MERICEWLRILDQQNKYISKKYKQENIRKKYGKTK